MPEREVSYRHVKLGQTLVIIAAQQIVAHIATLPFFSFLLHAVAFHGTLHVASSVCIAIVNNYDNKEIRIYLYMYSKDNIYETC
jgi:hypothetical protein